MKRFSIGIIPQGKQQGGAKYALKIEKPSIFGNIFGLTEKELIELKELIESALKK